MRRPIETLFSLPRVRLVDRVPVIETERLVRLYLDRPKYQRTLIKRATEVSKGSYVQFSRDEEGLTYLLDQFSTDDYSVTARSRTMLSGMLGDIYGDGVIFKNFERNIEPLCSASGSLRQVSLMADRAVDSTKEYSLDLARLLGIRIPGFREDIR